MVTINDITNQGGLHQKEFEIFERIASHLLDRVDRMSPRTFHGEIALKDRETRNQKVTFEIHLGKKYFVSHSEEQDIPKAIAEAVDKMFAQVNKYHDQTNRKQTRRRSKGLHALPVEPEAV